MTHVLEIAVKVFHKFQQIVCRDFEACTLARGRETNPRESDQSEILRGTRDLDSAFYRVSHSTSTLIIVVRTPGIYQSLTFLRNKYINQRQLFFTSFKYIRINHGV